MSFKEFLDHLKSEGQVIKNAPVAFCSFVVIAGFVIFLFVDWHYVGTISEKDSTITQKEATITTVSAERDSFKDDNEKLRNENAQYQAAHDEKAFPLKKRVKILASQISEWSSQIETNRPQTFNSPQFQTLVYEWEGRFWPRLQIDLKQLDEIGQHSEQIEIMNFNGMENMMVNFSYYQPQFYAQMQILTNELNRLAENLPDTETQ
jgi:hypothetical protein